jgi:hypothetical protein
MMADLISRQAAYEVLTEYYHHRTEIQHQALKEALDRVPAVQPEIIRCKDCKHWKIGTEYLRCPNPAVCGLHSFMHSFERAALPEDYCSWAVRRSDERQT